MNTNPEIKKKNHQSISSNPLRSPPIQTHAHITAHTQFRSRPDQPRNPLKNPPIQTHAHINIRCFTPLKKKKIVFIVFSHFGNEIQTTVPIETPVKGRNLFFRRKEVEHTWGERWRNRRGKWRRSWVCREWKWRDRPARNRTSHAFQRYQKNSGFFSGN